MKENLYTIPLVDALSEHDECPFCVIERKLERDALDYILGSASAYMQVDIREVTDRLGFCRKHFKEMFQYGNSLGNAIMLSSYYHNINQQLSKKLKEPISKRASVFRKKDKSDSGDKKLSISSWIREREDECQICRHFKDQYQRYIETFFYLIKNDDDFYNKVKESKGFCMHHYAELAEGIDKYLSGSQKEKIANELNECMKRNMDRVEADLKWFIEKFDYRNKDADWKESRDALPRAMQKIAGGYPADQWYVSKK